MKARVPWSPTKEQQKAIDDKIRENVLIAAENLGNNMDASILWTLHRTFGFGKKRLRRFYEAFSKERTALEEHYEMGGEANYLCRVQLKKIGVDIDAWNKEFDRRQRR